MINCNYCTLNTNCPGFKACPHLNTRNQILEYENYISSLITEIKKQLDECDEETSEKIEEMISNLEDYTGWHNETVIAEGAYNIFMELLKKK